MKATVPVSTIIPCHNCAATVGRALSSVLAQTRPPAELILVDDASDDGGATRRELRALGDRYRGPVRIEIIEHSANLGAAAARNTGWEAASQPYLAFLDADDAWGRAKLELQFRWMERHPDVAMSGHLHSRVRGDAAGGAPAHEDRTADMRARQISLRRLLLSNVFATRTVMLLRALPFRFDPGFRRSDDFLLWLTIVNGGYQAWLLDAVLAFSFKAAYGEGGLSLDLWAMEKSELAVYGELARQGAISPLSHRLLALYSILKHARRVASRALATSRSASSPTRT